MRPAGGRLGRFAWPAAAVAVLLALFTVPANAAVTPAGACTASLNGIDVTSGHDTTGTAVHVDASTDAQFTGEAPGETVEAFRLSLQLGGLSFHLHPGTTNGSQWANKVEVAKYSWAAIGMYRLVGTATDGSGTPICTTTAYMCVDGKLAVLTVVGALAV